MKLFYQLNEKEQNSVLNYCARMVVSDMIDEGVKFEPLTDDEWKIKETIEKAIAGAKNFPTKEEKAHHLMSDEFVSRAIYDIALEMCKTAFYHENDEMVIFPAGIAEDGSEIEPEAVETKADGSVENVVKKNKKSNNLN